MTGRKSIVIFLGGVAVGGIGSALIWKYRNARRESRPSFLKAIQNVDCWPMQNANCFSESKVHVICDLTDLKNVIGSILNQVNLVKVMGFDCEWTSTNCKSNPVALLQLTTSDHSCYLLRLNKLKGFLPKEILTVLQDKSILKVGVGILDDATKLLKDYNIVVQGCVDLRALATRYQLTSARGLKSMAKDLLGISLEKSYKLRCSDWDQDILTEEQIRYAALDSFSSLRIFEALLCKKMLKNPTCKDDITKAAQSVAWSLVRSSIQGLVDMVFKENKSFQSTKCRDLKGNKLRGLPKDPTSYKKIKLHSVRQQPLYDNCKLLAPDDQLLSTCDRKKASWYLHKGLAEQISEEPFTIRLFFEPSGRPENDRDYYLYEKENKCVVCGSDESYVRKNVVPHEYRKHFALAMKDHTSHDILLLCVACHQRSNYYDCVLKRELAEEYGAPEGSLRAMHHFEDPIRRAVRSAGRALLNGKDKIPAKRKFELEQKILEFYSAETLTDKLVNEASNLEIRIENESYIPHGEKVVTSIYKKSGTKGLLKFEKRWRQHFLDNMSPQHMPTLWSIDHNHEKAMRREKEMEEEYTKKVESMSS